MVRREELLNPKQKGILARTFLYLVLFTLAILFLIPVFGVVITSFKSAREIFLGGFWAIPREISLSGFKEAAVDGKMARYILNSFLITVPSVAGAVFISSLGAYALARLKFRGSTFLFLTFISGMFLPQAVHLGPLFKLMDFLNLLDTYPGIIAVHISFGLPFGIFVLRNFLITIPFEIQDAARIDGCSEVGIYWRVIMPLSKPALAVLAIISFTWIWNDLLWALVLLSSDSVKPAMVGLIGMKGQYLMNWNVLNAGALLASIPVLAMFLLLQKHFIRGLIMGAVKG